MQIDVDLDLCCASGMCALVAGELFDQSDRDGTVIVRRPRVPARLQPIARECERNCPCGAISVRLIEDSPRRRPGPVGAA